MNTNETVEVGPSIDAMAGTASVVFETPIGWVRGVANDRAIVSFGFIDGVPNESDASDTTRGASELLATLRREIDAYFRRELRVFSVPCDAPGTEFHRIVWRELRLIPWGKTISYAELAERVGNPSAVRAVGGANARNPIAILVPCHRVIGASGMLTGYAGGLERKRALLEIEHGSGLFTA